MDPSRFAELSTRALEYIDEVLGDLEHEHLDVELAGDVLTLSFSDGGRFIINAHSAAGQVWMAANTDAWHFDWDESRERWVSRKSGDELMVTLARTVGERLGETVSL